MKKLKNLGVVELQASEIISINGGGRIVDFLSDCCRTVGSYLHGLWDGLMGNDPIVTN